MKVSVSDILAFLRCRRSWDYGSYNRQNLRPIKTPEALYIGEAIHVALQANIEGRPWWEALNNYWDEHFADGERQEQNMLSRVVLQHYFLYWGEDNPYKPLRPLTAELSFRIPVPTVRSAHFIGTFDAVLLDDRTGKYALLDHKTFKANPSLEDQEWAFQFTAYAWAALQLFGEPPAYVIYDGIKKKMPKVPEVLKDGTLSMAMSGMTDAWYRWCYADHLRRDGTPHDEVRLNDFLARLEAQRAYEQNDYFTRWKIRVEPEQLLGFERYLPDICRDMRSRALRIYPSFRRDGCWDCSFKHLCHAQERGDDVDYLLQTGFELSPGYGTTKAQELTPHSMRSIDDLKKVAVDGISNRGSAA